MRYPVQRIPEKEAPREVAPSPREVMRVSEQNEAGAGRQEESHPGRQEGWQGHAREAVHPGQTQK